MSSPGTLRFGQVATKPSAPPVGYDLIYVKTDDVLYIQDSAGVEVALGSASAITSLSGDATATGPGAATITINFVGGASAASIAAAAAAIGTATPLDVPNTVVERDSSGNFAAGTITASLNGNANTATTSIFFSGSLAGDVTGTQGATTVAFVGGKTATDVAAATGTVDAATALNTASTLVKRDASGDFAAHIITSSLVGNVTGNLTGNVTGNVSGSAASFTGSLAGDVSGTQSATSVDKIKGTAVNATAPTDAQFLVYQTGITAYKPASMSGDATMTDTGVVSVIATTNSTITTLSALSLPTTQLTGTLQAAQEPAHTGDVTNSAGSLVLSLVATTNSTLTTLSALSLPTTQLTGTLQAAQEPAHTGDVTNTAGSLVLHLVATTNSTLTTLTALALPTTQLTGTLQAAQEPAHTGDVTNTAGSLVLSLVATTNSTLTTLTALALPTTQLTGTLQAAQFPALLGDVTTTAGSLTTHLVATTNSTLVTLSALSLPGSQVTGDIAGNAANVNGVVAILHGGTGQTTANAAFNALSPMTTLGDIIYENATPAAARLPGNTTAAREFLTSQGTGTLANAPTWSGLVSGDIPNNAANTSGTAANITATTNSTLTSLPSLTSATSLAILGSQVGGFTQGSVIFAGATGALAQDNANFYWNDTTLALGIGVQPASTAVLDIVNNSGTTKAIQVTGYGSNVGFRGREAGGTLASPSATTSGTTLTFFSGRGYGTTAFAVASTGVINIAAAATFTDTSMPTYISFSTTPVGSVTAAEAMRISPAGNLLIGTVTDSGTQKLQVNGNSNVGTVTGGTWNATIIGVPYGGTGLGTAPANGQLLIGNGTTYTLSTLTAGTGISIANAAGSITITSSGITPLVTKTANYTILSTDGTILCDTSGGAFTLTLPNPSGLSGQIWRVIDSTGFFQSNNLTLAPHGAEKIEGLAASKVLQTPWGWFTITTNGTDWFVGG